MAEILDTKIPEIETHEATIGRSFFNVGTEVDPSRVEYARLLVAQFEADDSLATAGIVTIGGSKYLVGSHRHGEESRRVLCQASSLAEGWIALSEPLEKTSDLPLAQPQHYDRFLSDVSMQWGIT